MVEAKRFFWNFLTGQKLRIKPFYCNHHQLLLSMVFSSLNAEVSHMANAAKTIKLRILFFFINLCTPDLPPIITLAVSDMKPRALLKSRLYFCREDFKSTK